MSKHYLIRGARIVQQLLREDKTAQELERNTMTFQPPPAPDARQNIVNTVQVQKVEFAPNRQDGTLQVRVMTNSNGHQHQPSLLFDKIVYDDSDQNDNTSVTAIDRREYHFQPIQLNTHNCKVRCDCLDFFYRFGSTNAKDNSLLGTPPPPYQKRSNRPPVNPYQVPALCKHLLRAIQALRSVNVVR